MVHYTVCRGQGCRRTSSNLHAPHGYRHRHGSCASVPTTSPRTTSDVISTAAGFRRDATASECGCFACGQCVAGWGALLHKYRRRQYLNAVSRGCSQPVGRVLHSGRFITDAAFSSVECRLGHDLASCRRLHRLRHLHHLPDHSPVLSFLAAPCSADVQADAPPRTDIHRCCRSHVWTWAVCCRSSH